MNNVIRRTVRELERKYKDKPDEAIIWEIRTGRHAGEALFYLLFGRYADMLEVIYAQQSLTLMDFDDFMLELDIRLFKEGCEAMQRFQPGKASFKTYLSAIARHLLYDLHEKELPTLDVDALGGILYDEYESEEAVMSLVEEINDYPDKDSRYVLLKTIEGYKSKEIAAMLTGRKHEEGTLDESKKLKPSYIDTLRSRALKGIRHRILSHDNRLNIKRRLYIPAHLSLGDMVEASMAAPMPPVKLRSFKTAFISNFFPRKAPKGMPPPFKAGMFIGNIMNLYNQMMRE